MGKRAAGSIAAALSPPGAVGHARGATPDRRGLSAAIGRGPAVGWTRGPGPEAPGPARMGATRAGEHSTGGARGSAHHAGARPRDGHRPVCRGLTNPARDRADRRVGPGDRDLWLARDSESPRTGGVGRPGPGALSEWRHGPRPGNHARRQQARAPPDGAAGLELGALSAGQRADALVSGAVREREQTGADWHRGAGAEAPDCVVAV